MYIHSLKKNLLICTTAVTFAALSAIAGPGKSGGGDECENQLNEIKKDFLLWISEGGHMSLDLMGRISHEQYAKKMKAEIERSHFACVGPGDKGYPVIVNGTPKVCKFEKTQNQSFFKCDINKFLLLNKEQQYRKYHHEIAGLVGIEQPVQNKPYASTYDISNQLSLETVVVEKVKLRVTPKNLPVRWDEMLTKLDAQPSDESDLAFYIRKGSTKAAVDIINKTPENRLGRLMSLSEYQFRNRKSRILSPLSIAVIMENTDVLKAFASRKLSSLKEGFMLAIEMGKSPDILDIFINSGVDMMTPDTYNLSALEATIKYNQEKMFFYLVNRGADIHKEPKLKHWAALYSRYAILKYLDSKNAPLWERSLFTVISEGNAQSAIQLFEMGADGKNALSASTRINNYALTDYFLNKGLDPNKTEDFKMSRYETELDWKVTLPIYNAIYFNNLGMFDRLIRAGANPNLNYLANHKGSTDADEQSSDILYYTVKYASTKVFDKVINYRSDFHSLRINGLAPVHAAVIMTACNTDPELTYHANHCDNVKARKVEMLKKLAALKVDFNLPDSKGLRPLDHADETEIIDMLIKLGADTNKISNQTKQRLKKMDYVL